MDLQTTALPFGVLDHGDSLDSEAAAVRDGGLEQRISGLEVTWRQK